MLSIATPESAAPLLNTLTHSLTPPLILLNIRIVAAATPANTAPSTVHLNPLKSIRIKAIGIIEITKLGRSFASLSLSSSAVSCVFNVGSLKSLPFFVKYLALYSSHTKININSTIDAINDGTKAAVALVPRFVIAILFWIDGEPGAVIDHVQHPADIAAGISILVRLAFLNI